MGMTSVEHVITSYPERKRFTCVHAQERHGWIAAMCVFCAACLGEVKEGEEEGEEVIGSADHEIFLEQLTLSPI
jgi:hypothetical protein